MGAGPRFNQEKCTLCGVCVEICPRAILKIEDKKVVQSGDCLMCAHCYAVCRFGAVTVPGLLDMDQKGQGITTPGTSALIDLIKTRRSIRRYTGKIPGREIIDELINCAVCAPSGSNCQSWRFTVVYDPVVVGKLWNGVMDFYRRLNTLSKNPLVRLLSRVFMGDTLVNYYLNRYQRTVTMLQKADSGLDPLFYHAPVIIIIHSGMEGSTPVEDAQYAGFTISLLAHALGMGTCYIGYAAEAMNRVRALREAVGIPVRNRVHLVITLGYPAVTFVRPAMRKPFVVDFR